MAMSTQTIYRVVYGYTKQLFKDQEYEKSIDDTIRDWTPTSANKLVPGSANALVNLLAHLQKDMRETANKRAGKADLQKSMQAIIKNAQKDSPYRKVIHGYYVIDGDIYASDNYRVIHSYDQFEIGKPVEGFKNTQDLINKAKVSAAEILDLPTVGDLKSFIALKKAESKDQIIYEFGEGKPMVNATYLIDMITAFKNVKAYYNINAPATALYFEGDDGEGVLMPFFKKG